MTTRFFAAFLLSVSISACSGTPSSDDSPDAGGNPPDSGQNNPSDGGNGDGGSFSCSGSACDGGLDAGIDGGSDAGHPSCASVGCDGGLSCCGDSCVDIGGSDPLHCGSCGNACGDDHFCSTHTCVFLSPANACAAPEATVLVDGLADDEVARDIGSALLAQCVPPPTLDERPTSDAGNVLQPGSFLPNTEGNHLLVAAGGPYVQPVTGAVDQTGKSQVVFTDTAGTIAIKLRDGGTLVSVPESALDGGTHDWFVVQMVRTGAKGSTTLSAYGFLAGGTAAAAFYLKTQLLVDAGPTPAGWYVVEWQDQNANGTPDLSDLFTVIATGSP